MATAELDTPEIKEPVTESGKTSLADAWKGAMKNQADAIAEPSTEEQKKEPVKEPEKKEPAKSEVKTEVKKEEVKKVSALDAALNPPVEKVEEVKTDEIPANAPAKTLREAYERQKSEAARWKAEAEKAAKGDPATRAQIDSFAKEREKLAKENAELRDAVTALNVEYDPEFRSKFVDGKSNLLEKAASAVEKYGGNVKAFREAMELPAGKAQTQALREALEEVDELDRPAIHEKLGKLRELEEERADILKNSQKSYAELSQKQQAKARENAEKAQQSKLEIFGQSTKALSAQHPTIRNVPESVEGHEEWNGRLKTDHDNALKLLSPEATLEEISAAAVKGSRYDFVEGLLLEERNTSAQLREQLAKYESAEPGFDGRQKTDKVSKLDKTPAQLYKEKLAELSGRE